MNPLLTVCAALVLTSMAQAQLPPLTMQGPPPGPSQSPLSPGLARTRVLLLDTHALASSTASSAMQFQLFEDLTLRLAVSTHRVLPNGVQEIQGEIQGDPLGTFSITITGDLISGGVWTSHATYGFAPAGRTDELGRPLTEIREWQPGATIRCAMSRDTDLIAPGDDRTLRRYRLQQAHAETDPVESPAGSPPPPPPSGACSCGDDGNTIDALFLYTTLAKNAAGGAPAIQARVNDAVAACNLSYVNSNISVGTGRDRLVARVAGFGEITYNEVSPDWLDHLSRLSNPTDGFIDNAIALRNSAHADVVCLIVDDTRFTGGAAFYALYVRDSAAQVLNWRALGGGSLTYAHELGHTYGCAHDRGNSSFSLFPYAWGYSFAANNTTYGTIMSYTGAVPLPQFSNPTILHSSGQPTGVGINQPLPAYNALAISQAKWTIANHADSGRVIDCNGNGIDDTLDIAQGRSLDLNHNCRPDECERRVYVDANNTGVQDGATWNTAYTDLGQAMIAASLECNNISEIWVADGVYRPDTGSSDRYANFALRTGLAIYGGFQGKSRPGGSETDLSQRVFNPATGAAFPSILTGDIGVQGNDTDNSFSVVTADTTDATAVLDGFTIQRGYQDFDGAGMYVFNAAPSIRRCVFRNNRGGGSGAALTTGPFAGPLFDSCVFQDNTASGGSGGSVGLRDGASATFQNCLFKNCTARFGGAAYLYNGSSATFTSCTFQDNAASDNSGAIDTYLNCSLTVQNCQFLRNHAGTSGGGSGGALISHTGSSAVISGSTFANCDAPNTGGAIWADSSTLAIDDSTFTSNHCGDGGGAISAYSGSTVTLRGSTLSGNQGRWGGGIAIADSTINASRTAIVSNSASAFSGGGIDTFNITASSLTSCGLAANTAADGGAGISLGSGSALSVNNCTIAANTAINSGGGIGMFNATLGVANSILFGNHSGAPGAQSLQDQQLTVFSGTRTINRSCVQGLTGSLGGTGNIGANPQLTNPAAGDLSLLAGSPCIDAGSNSLLPVGQTLDLLSHARRTDDPATADTGVGPAPVVDIGAVEFQPPLACPADFNQDGDLNPDDLGDFITCYFTEPPCPGADYNADSDVNPDDLGDFITAYFTGC